MSNYLSRAVSSESYRGLRDLAKHLANHVPRPLRTAAEKAEEYARGMVTGGTLFEELGFYYIGPVDGHNLDHLVPVLKNVRDHKNSGPVLIHVRTRKGAGYPPAEKSADKYHGVVKFDTATGAQFKKKGNAPSYTSVFAKGLLAEAEHDDKIVAITAAMPSGTGVDAFIKAHPDRSFDVGIAEQHGVTFAAGLACEGYKPFCAIYSTFLQRGYDQVVHDVAIQGLPVRFVLDRAGAGRRRRADPRGRLRCRLSRLSAGLRDHGGGRRGGADAYGGDAGGNRRLPVRPSLSPRRGRGHRPAGTGYAA